MFSARDIFLPLPRSGGGEGRGEGESLFQSCKSLLSPALSSMGWRRGRRGTLNSYYLGDYHPLAADVSPRKLGDSRDCREFIGSMLLLRGAQILLTSAATLFKIPRFDQGSAIQSASSQSFGVENSRACSVGNSPTRS